MNNRDIEALLEQHQRDIEAIKQALAGLRISTGKTGNQWFTIPEPPMKGEGHGRGQSSAALPTVRQV
jgi:hypothetical protein